jgi:hypothetical protein
VTYSKNQWAAVRNRRATVGSSSSTLLLAVFFSMAQQLLVGQGLLMRLHDHIQPHHTR